MTNTRLISGDPRCIEVPIDEAMRYIGVKGDAVDIKTIAEDLLKELREAVSLRAVCAQLPLSFGSCSVKIGEISTDSAALRRSLEGCGCAVVFAATIGVGADKLVTRYSKLSPSKAVILGGLGSAMIESFCDFACHKIAAEYNKIGKCIKPRFSPGYGGFSLSAQTEIARILDTERQIGLYFTDSLMMIPEKSVTAVMGIYSAGE